MSRLFIVFLLMFCIAAEADKIKNDCLPFDDDHGNPVCEEYIEQCTDSKGRFVYCEDRNKLKNVFKRINKSCRNLETGKFMKCPSEDK